MCQAWCEALRYDNEQMDMSLSDLMALSFAGMCESPGCAC